MEQPAIRLVRPLQTEYIVVGGLLMNWHNTIYTLTEEQFVGECMRKSHGSMNPNRVREIYKELMEEAGVDGTKNQNARETNS